VLGVDNAQLWNVLDPAPLKGVLEMLIPLRRIKDQIKEGRIDAVAVVATSALSGRSVVFHQSGRSPDGDAARRIDYVATLLSTEHLLASTAIPGLFPAVEVTQPKRAAGWYWDGGTRLNTPIKPALALGAERVIAIGLNSIVPSPRQIADPQRPDAFAGVSQLLQSVFVDSLLQDLTTLTAINEAVAAGFTGRRLVPYIFIAPDEPDAIGRLAQEVFSKLDIRSRPLPQDMVLLGRAVDGQLDPIHGELLSLLFFDKEFLEKLFDMGRRDARAWIAAPHSDGLWETGPLRRLSAGSWAQEGHPVSPPPHP
jgi:NTE family protein